MTKLSTKNVNLDSPTSTGGGDYLPPVLRPGNYKIRINDLTLKEDKFSTKITLFVETEAVPGAFKGLPKSKDTPNDTYKGQIGYVSLDRYGYKDWTSPQGAEVKRDDELFRAIGLLCRRIGTKAWWEDADGKYDTVDELVAGFIKDRPFENRWFFACLSGREYQNGKYINNELFFGREDRVLGLPYSTDETKVQKFFASSHIIRLENKVGDVNKPTLPTTTNAETNYTVVHSEPAKPQHQSQAEMDFMKQGEIERAEKERIAQSNAEFLAEMNKDNPVESNTDIVKDDGEKLPWE